MGSTTQARILDVISVGQEGSVWLPSDFARIANRRSICNALQKLCASGVVRRISRGLYDKPRHNRLTGHLTVPNYRAVIEAIARRDNLRLLIDGMSAANDLGMTNAVPARVIVFIPARRRPFVLGNLIIEFKRAPPSRFFWAERPAMRVVQALYWLKDTLPDSEPQLRLRLREILRDPVYGEAIRQDLADGHAVLPLWMQRFLLSCVS
ncbi:DUF6088 family protein [Pandoraea sp. PE-S2R-1]|uniref:DUF6088 family protein n=1 Tax=Pandoraea sp. PE-S2R-1 TaxID=1986994 RepID=UPI000B3FA287|nr:DUF6088 family protein [Pandoraea sp. PE-S2R-1]